MATEDRETTTAMAAQACRHRLGEKDWYRFAPALRRTQVQEKVCLASHSWKSKPRGDFARGWDSIKSLLARGERLKYLCKAILALSMTLSPKGKAHIYLLTGKPA